MTAIFELDSPDATEALLSHIKSMFTGRLQVTVSTLDYDVSQDLSSDSRSLQELMDAAPIVKGFKPFTRAEIYTERRA